ncbi:electron transfer flavoprotein subunit beta/FixA family protein [Acetobacter tropicalis]|uniref:Electron transfer flavoprotein subunit beta n=1 Tax=Acetobacter tropicalis TaxID=104102 RepID=A0A094YLK7_9PROT|nr:electron transfer flavoprotein subunit beta/FixA family protein [Acetobacter tropicalis]KAA8391321.1 electron transfer flavoprotein subunit beta/FixA family protein [Acetobacter tropicalis]KAA8391566.1 electron transfer flavoprotein subunit beta/FixA family protein [Acetobacter tropicalis]KGB21524.1 Electron transfer flavoprotein, beta subunit [Acetobacter tropicalis]MBC9007831.1 electron transfer flavoprotein subunit beta/FixA family protein [Acetobacter tropicalis]MDO8172472.1 electron tr
MKKILVPIKMVLDANVRPRVKADGSGVDLSGMKLSINPFCEIAIEEAVRLKEKGLAEEVVAISIGPAKAQDILRQAMAMGADRARLIETDRPIEPLTAAKLIRTVVEEENPDLVILGKQAVDDDCNQTGQMLAALLDWPQATFASAVAVDAGTLHVTREVDGGHQTLALPLPAVVTTDLRLNEPRHCSLPNIMKARKKALDITPVANCGLDLAARLNVLGVKPPEPRKTGRRVANVSELVGDLRAAGVI